MASITVVLAAGHGEPLTPARSRERPVTDRLRATDLDLGDVAFEVRDTVGDTTKSVDNYLAGSLLNPQPPEELLRFFSPGRHLLTVFGFVPPATEARRLTLQHGFLHLRDRV